MAIFQSICVGLMPNFKVKLNGGQRKVRTDKFKLGGHLGFSAILDFLEIAISKSFKVRLIPNFKGMFKWVSSMSEQKN